MPEDTEKDYQKTELNYYSQQLDTFLETDYFCPPAFINKFYVSISHTVLIANAKKMTERSLIDMRYICPGKQVLSYE